MADPITAGIAAGAALLNLLLSFIFPVKTKQEGQRLDNLDVAGSSFGAILVWGAGTFRTAGQTIWIKNNKIQEVVTTETMGAKGGPQVEVTTYSYYGNFAVAFTSVKVVGFSRIWINKKTVFNVGAGASEETVKNSWEFANKYIRFYYGNPDQPVDPLIQSVEGSASAYRYCSYIVFENLPLADYGNTLPQVEVEAVVNGRWTNLAQYITENSRPQLRLYRYDVQLSELINILCEFAGLQEGEWDASDLEQITVYGYTQSSFKTINSIFDELRRLYFFDIIESDKIYFRRQQRNGVVATISSSFLAAHEASGQRPVTFEITQVDPPSLPTEISLTYRDPDKYYQQSTVYARRQGDSYYNKLTVATELCLYPSQAQVIVNRYLSQIWAEKDAFKIYLPPGLMSIEANDVIAVELISGQIQPIRITQVTLGANNLLEVIGVNGAYALIEIDLQGTLLPQGSGSQSEVYALPTTDLQILDIPLIRFDDTELGVYAIASGGERWKTAHLYGSLQENTGYEFAGNLLYSSTYGTVITTVPSAVPELVDRVTTIRVSLQTTRMAVYSITYDELLQGSNLILIGSEVMAFQTAEQVGETEWELSTLLRGLRGTEWAVDGHSDNERFVLLSGYCQRVPFERTRLRQTGYWIAPTPGQALDEPTPIIAGYTGVDLIPYSPVRLSYQQVSGDYNLSWIRRDRKGRWYDFTDIELSEATEQYLLKIWASGIASSPVKEYEVTTTAKTYTNSEIVADFGTIPSHFWFSVQQFSIYVGYGYSSERIEVLI